jgi:hypothetical protein
VADTEVDSSTYVSPQSGELALTHAQFPSQYFLPPTQIIFVWKDSSLNFEAPYVSYRSVDSFAFRIIRGATAPEGSAVAPPDPGDGGILVDRRLIPVMRTAYQPYEALANRITLDSARFGTLDSNYLS